MVSAVNAAGFSATLDASNNLTVVGNNVDTTAGQGAPSLNKASAAGTGAGSASVTFGTTAMAAPRPDMTLGGLTSATTAAGSMSANAIASAFSSIAAGSVQHVANTAYTLTGTALFTTSSVTGANQTSLNFTSGASNKVALAGSGGGWTTNAGVITNSDNDVAGTTLSGAAGAIANITAAVTKLGTISSSLGSATQEITGMQSFSSSLSDALTAGVGGADGCRPRHRERAADVATDQTAARHPGAVDRQPGAAVTAVAVQVTGTGRRPGA